MDTLIFLIGITAIMAVMCLAAYVLAWLLTEVVRLPIQVRPFNCRQCLTFWLSVILNAVFAFIVTPTVIQRGITSYASVSLYAIIGVGILMGLLNFLYVKTKFRIYE